MKPAGRWDVRYYAREGHARPRSIMLNVPTLWTVFIVNFLALGLIWAYVMRSYPNLDSARVCTGAVLSAAARGAAAASGGAVAMLRFAIESMLPLLAGATVLVFAPCLAAKGIQRFYGREVSWR